VAAALTTFPVQLAARNRPPATGLPQKVSIMENTEIMPQCSHFRLTDQTGSGKRAFRQKTLESHKKQGRALCGNPTAAKVPEAASHRNKSEAGICLPFGGGASDNRSN